ncbi:ABC transporter ATP-binding protein [Streptomyces albidoflavus]|uniref:ABC transporter ATP-binding protein n=1 Tax=Streptomyces albidoflavus TaxID=1886 RepID=UPI0004BE858D|nr:ABC transporter ATP-binding protein [Streptomyces albidoflavus]
MTTTAKTATVPGPRAAADYDGHLLEVRDLHVEFHTRDGVAKAVNGVNYTVDAGETLAVLGESGSGKSVTAQAIMGILDMPPGRIPQGEVLFRGQDMLTMGKEERRKIRGQKIAMIFQDALSSLNPVLSVGYQLGEMFRVHQGLSKKEAKAKAIELMERVKIPAAKERVNDYPHQFSGGMRMGLILITHDLGVVADVADKIAVMYAGRIVETAPVHELYARPAHPYTRGLLDSIPRLDQKGQELYAIKGLPPNLTRIPSGCAFNPRCPMAQDICRTEVPTLAPVTEQDGTDLPGRGSACHFWKETIHG